MRPRTALARAAMILMQDPHLDHVKLGKRLRTTSKSASSILYRLRRLGLVDYTPAKNRIVSLEGLDPAPIADWIVRGKPYPHGHPLLRYALAYRAAGKAERRKIGSALVAALASTL